MGSNPTPSAPYTFAPVRGDPVRPSKPPTTSIAALSLGALRFVTVRGNPVRHLWVSLWIWRRVPKMTKRLSALAVALMPAWNTRPLKFRQA